ncbi:N-acetyltransferase family protein [Tundrisphaera lichenicola]|uniref:GNAT family N-acetyltransferase n=1 Tax=Tundrisphaera lichenicola TaxID=2029860 RepID=UPI003EB9AB41
MAQDLTVRDARPEDRDVIVDFNLRLAQETEGKSLDLDILTRGVAAALQEPDRLRYWVVEPRDQLGRVIGQAAVTREWSDWRAGWIWWFQSVYVHREYRGLGAFRALHAQIRNLARQTHDVIGLRLYVEVENEAAQRVYQTLGMKPGGYDVYEELWLGSGDRP